MGAAVEADAIGEQQLFTESCPVPDYSCRRTKGKQRAKRAMLIVVVIITCRHRTKPGWLHAAIFDL